MESLKYISLLLLIPEVLSGNVSKEQLLDEMVKLGLTEEEKNELLKRVEENWLWLVGNVLIVGGGKKSGSANHSNLLIVKVLAIFKTLSLVKIVGALIS